MQNYNNISQKFSALANPKRLMILSWLRNPARYFPQLTNDNLQENGVSVSNITKKLGVKQPTVSLHMQVLAEAGLVTSNRFKQWRFYKINSEGLSSLKHYLDE